MYCSRLGTDCERVSRKELDSSCTYHFYISLLGGTDLLVCSHYPGPTVTVMADTTMAASPHSNKPLYLLTAACSVPVLFSAPPTSASSSPALLFYLPCLTASPGRIDRADTMQPSHMTLPYWSRVCGYYKFSFLDLLRKAESTKYTHENHIGTISVDVYTAILRVTRGSI